jgi:hypothetical protein
VFLLLLKMVVRWLLQGIINNLVGKIQSIELDDINCPKKKQHTLVLPLCGLCELKAVCGRFIRLHSSGLLLLELGIFLLKFKVTLLFG